MLIFPNYIWGGVCAQGRTHKNFSTVNDKFGAECAYGDYEQDPEEDDDGKEVDDDNCLCARCFGQEVDCEVSQAVLQNRWPGRSPYVVDPYDNFPFWNIVIGLADNIITDPDTLPFWHGLAELRREEQFLDQQPPNHKREVKIHPTRLLSPEEENLTRAYLDKYRHRVRVHIVKDTDDSSLDGYSACLNLPKSHPEWCKHEESQWLGFANDHVVATQKTFRQVFVSASEAVKYHWTQRTMADIRATIVKLAVTVVHEVAHALGDLIVETGRGEPYVNGGLYCELGFAAEQFLFGGQLIWCDANLAITPWPDLRTIEDYSGGRGMKPRGFLMPDEAANREFIVGEEECKRFLSDKMWSTRPNPRRHKRRKARRSEKRLDILWDGISAVPFQGQSITIPGIEWPQPGYDHVEVSLLAQAFGSLLLADKQDLDRWEPDHGEMALLEAAKAHPFHKRAFRLKKMRLMPYHEMPETKAEYELAEVRDPHATMMPEAKRLKASEALALRLKTENASLVNVSLMTASRIERMEAKREEQKEEFFEASKPRLDGFWSGMAVLATVFAKTSQVAKKRRASQGDLNGGKRQRC